MVIVVDTLGWFDEFAKRLVDAIGDEGDTVIFLRNCKDIDKADITFFLSCMKLTPRNVLAKSRLNLVVHASALPKGRGFSPIVWQILEGRNDIPITMINAVAEADAGDIVSVDHIVFQGHELNSEIRQALGEKVIEMCLDYLQAPAPPRSSRQRGKPIWYNRRTAKDSRLFPDKTIAEQFELLRVVDNKTYPAFFDYRGHRYIVKIEKAAHEPGSDD